MSRTIMHHLLRGTTALAVLAPVAAFAQSSPASQGFEEIIVTAQKRAENLQDVPIQVSAFTEQAIADAGIKSTRDFVAMVPNMSFDESFTYLNSFVTIRGISQLNNGDSPVAIVIDGVPQNNQKQFKMNLIDIERIEVLKGPQGALYGRNASGGAVNIVTKQPTNEFEGFVNGTYGNGDAWELAGGVSGPIVKDKVLFRVTGYYKQDDGRIDNTYLNTHPDYIDHDYGIRGMLKVNASDNLTFDFRASYTDFKAGGLYDSAVFSGNADDFQDPSEDFLGVTFGDIKDATFKFDWDLGFATLTGISGYTDLKEYNRGDLDFTNPINNPGGFLGFLGPVGQGQNLDVQLYSQELRLVSPSDQRLRWIAGAYYLHTNRKLNTRAYFDVTHDPDQFENGAIIINLAEDNSNNAYAVFGQLDFDITDNLTLSGALRYDYDKRDQTDLVSLIQRKKSFDAIQPKATLTYKIDDDRLLYATYSTGFRSGGFNAPTVPLDVFRDETLQNFEGGFKTSWLNNRLIINGDVYFQKVDDFQIFFVDAANAAQYLANIDKVDIFGVELEFQAMPVEGLQIFGSIGTTDSEIKKNSLDTSVVGNQTPKNTRWKMNLGYQYRVQLAEGLSGMMRVDYEHRGKKIWQLDNIDFQRPVDIFNARIGVEGDNWGVYAWGKNLSNAKYYGDYNPKEYSGLGAYDIGFRAQPRTYGVEANYKF